MKRHTVCTLALFLAGYCLVGCSRSHDAEPVKAKVETAPAKVEIKPVDEAVVARPVTLPVDGYPTALNHMKREILSQLDKSKVLVIWCLDQSETLADDRQEIMSQVSPWYQELTPANSARKDSLLTSVMSFGAAPAIHTPKPTSNVEEILEAMHQVPVDPSGEEKTCQAIHYAIMQHQRFAKASQRQIMLILVTDESGDPTDNAKSLELTIAEAKAIGCGIYVLGREAVFGYPYAHFRWIDPKSRLVFWLKVDRGPETCQPEVLQIDGLQRRWDSYPSGFGPYGLTRLASETGGAYFILPSPETNLVGRDHHKPASKELEPYQPDLCSVSEYMAQRDKSELRQSVWKVISDLNPYRPKSSAEVRVEGFSLDKEEFAKQARAAQIQAQQLITYLKNAQAALDQVEPLRDQEASLRWRANFDLIHAQVVAYQVRLYEYGYSLEEFLKNPKPVKNASDSKRPTTHWNVVRGKKLLLGDRFKTEMELATERYKKIVSEHADTPYAARAQWELQAGFGVEMREDSDDPKVRAGVTVPKL